MTTDFYHSGLDFSFRGMMMNQPKQKQVSLSEEIVTAYMTLLNLGTDVIKDRRQLKYIQISNFVAMTSFLASLVYILLSIAWISPLWFIAVNSLCITSVSVLFLNKIGHVNISRTFYLVAVDILIYISALIIGPHTYGENFLLIAVLLPFLMYDLERIKQIAAGIILPVLLLLSYQYVEPFFSHYNLSLAHQAILRTIGVPMEAGLAIAAVFQFVYYSRQTEIELEASYQQLNQHATELKRSNADLEQFAYVISHDLKTPVRNIACFMKLLSKKHAASLNTEASEFVDFALNGAIRMERLIDDVLAYSKIGRNLSTPTPVNVNDVINTIKYELEARQDVSEATIIVDRELPVVNSAHSSLLYHIFHNLIRNGLKFNNSAKPEINISCEDSAEYYTFSVRDNGIGISKQYMAQIFQMFKRLHNENEYDGTGIGLAICKKIVEHFNGEIWFESDGEHGTAFFFTIRKY